MSDGTMNGSVSFKAAKASFKSIIFFADGCDIMIEEAEVSREDKRVHCKICEILIYSSGAASQQNQATRQA